MDEISAQHKDEVLRVQSLLAAGGIEGLHSSYFDMQLHGLWTPGSLDILCFVCSGFDVDNEPMLWNPGGTPALGDSSILSCVRCNLTIPFPCGSWQSEKLMETMRGIARGGMGWDDSE